MTCWLLLLLLLAPVTSVSMLIMLPLSTHCGKSGEPSGGYVPHCVMPVHPRACCAQQAALPRTKRQRCGVAESVLAAFKTGVEQEEAELLYTQMMKRNYQTAARSQQA